MKFKRLATMLMAAAMMVSLVACAGDNGENSETPVSSGNDVVEETEANHITLAESWGFENFLVEANEGKGIRFPSWTKYYLKYILPCIIIFIFIQGYWTFFMK